VRDITIDKIRVEALQTLIDGPKDMAPVQPRLYQPGTRAVTHLGGDHDLGAAALKRPAQHGFRFAARIRISRIKEIDAGVERLTDHGVGRFRLCLVNRREALVSRGKGHGPEGQAGDYQTRVAQCCVLHS
jgi:hypothetical protein